MHTSTVNSTLNFLPFFKSHLYIFGLNARGAQKSELNFVVGSTSVLSCNSGGLAFSEFVSSTPNKRVLAVGGVLAEASLQTLQCLKIFFLSFFNFMYSFFKRGTIAKKILFFAAKLSLGGSSRSSSQAPFSNLVQTTGQFLVSR